MTDEESNSTSASRKNSILVREDNSTPRGQVYAHPHFVESITPFRSPSVTLSDSQQEQYQPAPQPFTPQYSIQQPSVAGAQQQLQQQQQQQQQLQQQQLQQQQQQQSQPPPQPQISKLQLGGRPGTYSSAGESDYGRVSPTSGEPVGITPFGISGAAATDAWLSKPSRSTSPPHEAEPVIAGRATSKQPSDPRIPMDDGKIHILIGVTGSLYVSSVKQIIIKLQSIFGSRVAIQVIVTPVAEKMISNSSIKNAISSAANNAAYNAANNAANNAGSNAGSNANNNPGGNAGGNIGGNTSAGSGSASSIYSSSNNGIRIWHDADEWDTWHGRNDPVIHIELRRWADILLIAPLSANTLGKIAMGLCDNLLTNVVRAWNAQYPILIAPAMVAYAYNHPATKQHLRIIREEMKWIEILRPTEKVAGSTGGIGMGGMMPWNEIVAHVVQKLGGYPDEDEDEDDDDDDDDKVNNTGLDNDDDDDDDDEDDNDILQDTNDHDHQRLEYSSPGSPI